MTNYELHGPWTLIAASPNLLSELRVARQVLATACGEIAPYVKMALARIDAAINLAVEA